MELELIRDGSITGIGTFGVLKCGNFEFQTVEREWLDNAPNVSCIPTGIYRLAPYHSEKYPNHYALVNEALDVYAHAGDIPKGVKGRWGILIHKANLATQLEGCIAPGMARGYVTVKSKVGLGVIDPTPAFNTLMSQLDNESENTINITEAVRSW